MGRNPGLDIHAGLCYDGIMDNFIVLLAQCLTGAAIVAVTGAAIYAAMLVVTLRVLGLRPPGPPPLHATLGDR